MRVYPQTGGLTKWLTVASSVVISFNNFIYICLIIIKFFAVFIKDYCRDNNNVILHKT